MEQVLDKHPEDSKEKIYYLRVIYNVTSKLIKTDFKIYHLPEKLPMVCEPKKWVYTLYVKKNKEGIVQLVEQLYVAQ